MKTIQFQEALSTLNIEFPFDENALKTAFRIKSKETHPDCGGNDEEFKKVMSSYDLLKGFSQVFVDGNGLVTVEGISLMDLGKGLPEKNAVKCDACEGLGYTTTINRRLISGEPCPACSGMGIIWNYLGWGNIKEWKTCQRCQGRGMFSPVYQEKNLYHACTRCNGTGEIEIYNPVLKKGVVVTKEKYGKVNKKKTYCPECGARMSGEKCWRCNSTLMSIGKVV